MIELLITIFTIILFMLAGTFVCVIVDIILEAIHYREWWMLVGAIVLFCISMFCVYLIVNVLYITI